jgi:PAS domain S-box-containing protein
MDIGSIEEKFREPELVGAAAALGSEDAQRALVEAALRESEEKYRTLFDSIDNAITVLEVLYDDHGVARDLRFVESNQFFEKQTGLTNHLGKTTSELLPNLDDSCIQAYASVAETGKSIRFDSYSHDFGRWISIFASRVGGEGSPLVNAVFYDITERKQAEADLLEKEDRQAYLLKLSDALRELSDPIEIQEAASRLLGEQLQTDRVFYSEMDEARGQLRVERDFVRQGVPSLAGSYPLEAFAWIEQTTPKGQPAVIENVRTSPLISDAGRAVILGTHVCAFTCVPMLKNERRVGALCVAQWEPRAWKPAEIELVKETAERTWAAVERSKVETALRASEGKYRSLFDSIDQGYAVLEVVYDANGVASDLLFHATNRVFERHTGFSDYLGKTARQLNPNLEDLWIKTYARVIETGEPVRFEYFVKEIGRWFSIFASRLGGEGCHLLNVVFDDISERKRHEEMLRCSEEKQAYKLRLSDAIRPLSDPIVIQGRASLLLGEHLKANRVFYADIDEEASQMLVEREFASKGTPSGIGNYPLEVFAWLRSSSLKFEPTVVKDVATSELLPETDRATLAAVHAGAFIAVPLIKGGRLVACLCATYASPRNWTQDEVELVWHTGERTWAAVERARAEAALREGEERFRLFLENVREYALVQMDPQMRFTSWNPGAERIFGYSSEDAIGKPFSLLLSPEDREAQVPGTEIASLESDGRHEDARWLVHKNGSRIWARWVTEPIRNKEGQITGLAKVLRDETDRLKTEMTLRQSEKLAVVGRMASSIAHEINNPLEAVTNLVYLARRGVISPEVGEILEQAERELARVSHITTATLRFHRQTAEPHIVDIEEILESVLVLYEGRLRAVQVAIERRYSLHPSISCQAVEVRQVIANLVSNAIDAMLKNTSPRRLVVRLRKVADPVSGEEGVRVMIADTGVGIKESVRNHVFEPFFTTKSATGTGLGLWLSAETVAKHGGRLRFRSRTEGRYKGTVFSLFLSA